MREDLCETHPSDTTLRLVRIHFFVELFPYTIFTNDGSTKLTDSSITVSFRRICEKSRTFPNLVELPGAN